MPPSPDDLARRKFNAGPSGSYAATQARMQAQQPMHRVVSTA